MEQNLPDARPPSGVVYRHSVEALLNQVVHRHQLLSPAEFKQFGLEKPKDCDRDTWEALLRALARKRSTDGTEASGLHWVGREIIKGYTEGLVGRGLFIVLKLLGVKRSLLRMAENFQTADNMTKVYPRALGDKHVELLFNDIGKMPTYVQGVLSEALVMMGAPNHSVTFDERQDGYTRFDVKWS